MSIQKIKLEDVAIELAEIAEAEYPMEPAPIEEIKHIFSKVRYGEIIIKVFDGRIESMQIVNNYRPVREEDNA